MLIAPCPFWFTLSTTVFYRYLGYDIPDLVSPHLSNYLFIPTIHKTIRNHYVPSLLHRVILVYIPPTVLAIVYIVVTFWPRG